MVDDVIWYVAMLDWAPLWFRGTTQLCQRQQAHHTETLA